MRESIFKYLKEFNPYAYKSAQEVEELIFTHPNSSVVKAGIFIENIISDVFQKENLNEGDFKNLSDKIYFLFKEGYIKRDIYNSFTEIRKQRNYGAHESKSIYLSKAAYCHEKMFKIYVWYVETYCDHRKRIPEYSPPLLKKDFLSVNVIAQDLKNEIIRSITETMGKSELDKEDNHNEYRKSISANQQNYSTKELEDSLYNILVKLKESSQEAIENANYFSNFKKYLHVKRQVQIDLESFLLKRDINPTNGNLIFLCGNVGDGKSHVLAYLNEEKPDLIRNYKIINDATESKSPTMNAMETLEENLKGFSDEFIGTTSDKIILAINMGVLHNFINRKHKKYSYNKLKAFIDNSKIFSDKVNPTYTEEYFDLISFSEYQYYEITENGPKSDFYESLIEKITVQSKRNPFYNAYITDKEHGIYTIIHQNYEILQNKIVQKQIVSLIIKVIIKYKLVISARAFLNFIADILIPTNYSKESEYNLKDQINNLLPNLMFENYDRSFILNKFRCSDPVNIRNEELDRIYISLNTFNDFDYVLDQVNLDKSIRSILEPISNEYRKDDSTFLLVTKFLVRILFLMDVGYSNGLMDNSIKEYLTYVYALNTGIKEKIRDMYDLVYKCIYLWQGHVNNNYVFYDMLSNDYKIAQKIYLEPSIDHINTNTEYTLYSFAPNLTLGYRTKKSNTIFLEVDYTLYNLLSKVKNGYIPNQNDKKEAVKFTEFINKIMNEGEKNSEVLLYSIENDKGYILTKDIFGGYSFERIT